MESFLALGVSYFKFNPKANYNNQWVELKPLGTEGQGMPGYPEPYNLNSRALTFGFGNRFFLSSNISLTLEFLWRQTKTDYLDDASTNYVDYEALKQNNGLLAAELGNKIKAIGEVKEPIHLTMTGFNLALWGLVIILVVSLKEVL